MEQQAERPRIVVIKAQKSAFNVSDINKIKRDFKRVGIEAVIVSYNDDVKIVPEFEARIIE